MRFDASEDAVEKDRLFRSIIPGALAFDLSLAFAVALAWNLSVEIRDLAGLCGLWLLIHAIRVATWLLVLWRGLAPLRSVWARGLREVSASDLDIADAAVFGLPRRFGLVLGIGWTLVVAVIPGLTWFGFADVVTIGRNELFATSVLSLAAIISLPVLGSALLRLALDRAAVEVGTQLERRGSKRRRRSGSLTWRLTPAGIGLSLGPLLCLVSSGWYYDSHSLRAHTFELTHDRAESALVAFAHGAELPESVELVAPDQLPEPLGVALPTATGTLEAVDLKAERVFVARPTADGRFVVAEASSKLAFSDQLPPILVTAITTLAWAVLTITVLTRSFMNPLERLRDASKRVVERGDLREMGKVLEGDDDELGELTHNFNLMLGTFEELAAAAAKVAAGDLSVEIEGRGELPDAFRSMVGQLHAIVLEIRTSALELATAATEIYASTQEQDSAAGHQDAAMRSLDAIMHDLRASSSQVSEAAALVLDNAEGTLATTDETSAEIARLRGELRAVDELLSLVIEVANRSDLLALNGSLEATRAGEAGRGFALVAVEMRRLAERVTGTVGDIRSQVTAIHESSASTATATTRSHGLAEDTAKAAREIVTETRRQREGTEQAFASVGEAAEVIAKVQAAIGQTRATAEGLRAQALALEQLIDEFVL